MLANTLSYSTKRVRLGCVGRFQTRAFAPQRAMSSLLLSPTLLFRAYRLSCQRSSMEVMESEKETSRSSRPRRAS